MTKGKKIKPCKKILCIALGILALGLFSYCWDSKSQAKDSHKYFPQTKGELKALVEDKSIYLGDIDTSAITDMSYLFKKTARIGAEFNRLESWNTRVKI
ncbi:MAG: hypothetical protein NC548_59005 [Lachnospiraceae bacterium]|nr:hypothetical protein [Lachnospiraceae bacterium]